MNNLDFKLDNSKEFFKNILKKYRKYALFFCDFFIWNVSFYCAFIINNNKFSIIDFEGLFWRQLIIANVCFAAIFLLFRLYDKIWRYADIEDIFYAGFANFCANFCFFAVSYLLGDRLRLRSYILMFLVSSFAMFLFRLTYRMSRLISNLEIEKTGKKRLLIVGAGNSVAFLLREIYKSPQRDYNPICLVDDDHSKIGRSIYGKKVVATIDKIPEVCEKYAIETILFAINSITAQKRREILDICAKTNLEIKIMPNIYDVMTASENLMKAIRHVEVEDLLGRDAVIFEKDIYGDYLIDKTVMITGGGGSIGSELCRQIAALNPKKLIILDIYENGAYEIQQELKMRYGENLDLEVKIASIRDEEKMDKIFKESNINVVFHAAAHKHVPLMQCCAEEAVKNNVFGTLNLVRASSKYNVGRFVMISTDKAVNPTNIMGATKRVCEMIVQLADETSKTEFVVVRFGNVLGSNGSVVPLFEEQIKKMGPVTVTHPEIIRYFMTIPEAVSLVLTAGGLAKGGEIFVLDMGEPVKIKDLAENLIRLSGFIPYEDIKIEYVGLRPGEKLYEELLLDEEGIENTTNERIFIGKPIKFDKDFFESELEILKTLCQKNDTKNIEIKLKKMVPTFKDEVKRDEKT